MQFCLLPLVLFRLNCKPPCRKCLPTAPSPGLPEADGGASRLQWCSRGREVETGCRMYLHQLPPSLLESHAGTGHARQSRPRETGTCCWATLRPLVYAVLLWSLVIPAFLSTVKKPNSPQASQSRSQCQSSIFPGKCKCLRYGSSVKKTVYFYFFLMQLIISCSGQNTWAGTLRVFNSLQYLTKRPHNAFCVLQAHSQAKLSPRGWTSILKPYSSPPTQEQKGKGLGSGAQEFQLSLWPRQRCGWVKKAKHMAAAAEILGYEHLGSSCSEAL